MSAAHLYCLGYRPSLGWTPPTVKAGTVGNGCLPIDNSGNLEERISSSWTTANESVLNWPLWGIPKTVGFWIQTIAGGITALITLNIALLKIRYSTD